MSTVKSITEYIDKIRAIYEELEKETPNGVPNALFFRGHSKASYELLPSALRKDEEKGAEKRYLLNYRDNMPRHSRSYHFIKQRPEILADMQHFGMKTRLLDWTFSPLIALYFALKSDSGEEHSEVCVFNAWKYHAKFKKGVHSHDMHVLARSLLPDHEVPEIKNILKAEFYGETLSKEDLKMPFPFVAKYGNPRLIHQLGCFTIHGSIKTAIDCFDQVDPSSRIIRKIQISKKYRSEIFNDLNRLFINHYSVFPDLEGMSQHLKEYDSLYSSRKNRSPE